VNLRLRRIQEGYVPADEEAWAAFKRQKLGTVLHGEFKQERNYKFLRKWFALVQIAYDAWTEFCEPIEYKGQPVRPDFDRFRRDLTILAGFYRPVFNVKGEVRLEAESIAFGKMTEERFLALFDATISAVLTKVLPKGRFTETELRSLTEQVVEFA
jgi:hypothetical protein